MRSEGHALALSSSREQFARARRRRAPTSFPAGDDERFFALGAASARGIVLVEPFDLDTAAVDRVTGGHGYGHAAIFLGEVDRDGRPVAIDSSIAAGGVFRRLLSAIVRHVAFVVLPVAGVERAYARAAARVGEPYDTRALWGWAPRDGCATCSHLVWSCLDRRPRARVRPWREGWSVSPNCLFRAFAPEESLEAAT